MGARVITITSGKGGVGKTTATANLGVALALLGKRVACVDADIGLRNLDVVMGLENRIVYNLVDVIEGRARLRQAMIKDKRLKEELYLIPAAQTRDKTAVSPSDMVRLCDELREMVDFILIDSPAGIERGFRNAVAPADEVIIVTNPEVSSVRDADRIIGLLEAEGKGPGNLIINRVKAEMVKRGDMLSPDDIIDILSIKLIGLIPEDELILISTNRGTPAALNIEESRAGRAFTNVARRLLGEEVPFMSMEEETGLFKKLLRSIGLGAASSDSKPRSRGEAGPASKESPMKADSKPPAAPAPIRTAKPSTEAEPKPATSPAARDEPPAEKTRPAPRIDEPTAEPARPELLRPPARPADKPVSPGGDSNKALDVEAKKITRPLLKKAGESGPEEKPPMPAAPRADKPASDDEKTRPLSGEPEPKP